MTVRIGHASIDENGRAAGGAAGDQTGKELCIRGWYDKGWKVLLRAKTDAVGRKIAVCCMAACNNENLGYDQGGRNTGLQAAKKAGWDFSGITAKAEFDCSSLVSACVQAAGIEIWDGGNAPTTRTLEKVLTATGAFEVLKDERYLTGTDNLLAGDILLKPGSHVVIVLDDGGGACRNEISGSITYCVMLPLVKSGDRGDLVRAIQQLLVLHHADPEGVDGEFGRKTRAAVEKLQAHAGIEVDGKVGIDTWSVLLGKG